MVVNYTPEEINSAHEVIYNEGIRMRYQVASKEYVDKVLKAADKDYGRAMQEFPTSRLHTKGALTDGAKEEIREVILQAACYCGMPAGMEGFKVTAKAIQEWKQEQERKEEQVRDHTDLGLEQGVSLDE